MSPRPRLASNEQIMTGAMRAVARIGPARLTLADVAREAGISPAAIVQRFGSKRGLLLAMAAGGPAANRQMMAAIRDAHRSPYGALIAMGDCMAQLGTTPEEISNSLAYLQNDLSDPEFYRHTLATSGVVHDAICGLIADAIKAGELARCDVTRLARAFEATMGGSLINWAVYREGDVRDWIRRDLETMLRPYRARRRRRARRAVKGR